MSNFHPEYLRAQGDQSAWHPSSYGDNHGQSQRQLHNRAYTGHPAVSAQPVPPTQSYSASAYAYDSARHEPPVPMYRGQTSYSDPAVLAAQSQMPYGQRAPYSGLVYSPAEPQGPQAARLGAQYCFNCEGNDHVAAQCAHSRASYQPSSMQYQYGLPPSKKPRPNYIPPVVTTYEVPDHIKRKHLAETSKKNEDMAHFGPGPGPGPAFSQSQYAWQEGSASQFVPQSGPSYEAVPHSNAGTSTFGYNTWPAVQQPLYSPCPAPSQNALPYTPQASPAGQAYAGYQPPHSAVMSQAPSYAAYPVGSYPVREVTPIKSTSPRAYSFPVPIASQYEISSTIQTAPTANYEAEYSYAELSDRRRTARRDREPQRNGDQQYGVTEMTHAEANPSYTKGSAYDYDPLNPAAGLNAGTAITVSSDGSTKPIADRRRDQGFSEAQAPQGSGTRNSREKFLTRRAKRNLAREARRNDRSRQGPKASSQGPKAPQGPKGSHGSNAPAQGSNNPRQHQRQHKKSKKKRLLAGLGSRPAGKDRNGPSGSGS